MVSTHLVFKRLDHSLKSGFDKRDPNFFWRNIELNVKYCLNMDELFNSRLALDLQLHETSAVRTSIDILQRK